MWSRDVAFVLCLATSACSNVRENVPDIVASDAGGDILEVLVDSFVDGPDETRPDTTPDVSVDVLGETSDVRPPCSPIVGKEPFGVELSGTATMSSRYEDAGIITEKTTVALFFPKGRVAGAPVVLVRPAMYVRGLTVRTGVLRPDLGTDMIYVSDRNCATGVNGSLIGAADGLVGTYHKTISEPTSDSIIDVEGPISMCGSPLPEVWSEIDKSFMLTEPIAIDSNVPVDVESANALVVAGMKVAGSIGEDQRATLQSSKGAWPIGVYSIDLSKVRDVIGRPLKGLFSVEVQGPKTAATDLEFDTLPPPTSVFPDAFSKVTAGILRIPVGWRGLFTAVGIGDTAMTKAIIRHRLDCAPGAVIMGAEASIVAADGSKIGVPITCKFEETTVVLPGKGPFYLVARHRHESRPCYLTFPFGTMGYEIDFVRFVK